MRKYIYYTLVLLIAGFASACSKHELKFDTTIVDPSMAEFRLMYDIPDAVAGALEVKKLSYNDKQVSSYSTKVGEGFPNSGGRYHLLPAGSLKINLYRAGETLVYDQTISITAGKQTGFVYNLNEAPMIIQDEPFPVPHPWADTCCYIKFVNLMHKSDKVTPLGQLTLEVIRNISETPGVTTLDYIAIGTVNFKEATPWVKFDLKRDRDEKREPVKKWTGEETGLHYRLVDANGDVVFKTTSAGKLRKGLCYFFHANGSGDNVTSVNGAKRLGVWMAR